MKIIAFVNFLTILFMASSCSDENESSKAGSLMQEFVINISQYSRSIKSDFIIIPQNGVELAFMDLEISKGINQAYLNSINGVGVEELFYNDEPIDNTELLKMLRQIKPYVKVMVSDYVGSDENIKDAINKNREEGFLYFPRSKSNYYYEEIIGLTSEENPSSVKTLEEAQNYLYLINYNKFSSKKELIESLMDCNFDVLLIDLFFGTSAWTNEEIEQLKFKKNGSERLLIAYINIGAAETYRYYWYKSWKLKEPKWIAKKYIGYDNEFWVEFWDKEWQNIIYGNNSSYIKKIIDAGFDGAYLDNVEAYYFLYN